MSNKVTYKDIIEALSLKTGFTKQKSEDFAKALIEQVKQELRDEGKSSITNFGSFTVKEVSEREGVNPQTGEPITIPAHKKVTFTPYKALRERVNANYAHLESQLVDEDQLKGKTIIAPQKTRGKSQQTNQIVLLIALLMVVIMAIAAGWFLWSTDKEELASNDAAKETTQAPQSDVFIPDNESPDEESQNSQEVPSENQEVENLGDQELDDPTEASTSDYDVQQNDWYWVVAEKIYGSSYFWPLLFQQNQSVEDDPDTLYPSTGLKIPTIEGTPQNPTNQDYKKLSSAYSMVAEAYRNAGKPDKARAYAEFANRWE